MLAAFPDDFSQGMVLYATGHGKDVESGSMAGMDRKEFSHFVDALNKRDHPDCIVVNSCYGGAEDSLQLFPGKNKIEKTVGKTTYIVLGLGSVLTAKGKVNDYQSFYREADNLLSKNQTLRTNDFIGLLKPIGGTDASVNRPQIHFPGMGRFSPMQDIASVHTFTEVETRKRELEFNRNQKPYQVPENHTVLSFKVSSVEVPLLIRANASEPIILQSEGQAFY